ncbi:MAG TPA: xanthomonadin biosynthesis protein, partial [Rhodanobacteraceae bacterium]|nr:xanthomonadin biosynthesis protein [Rhodanobacteraceae bacterium]
EGPERIALPAVARYTHGLTAAWTALLALQALLLALLWLVLQVPALGALTGVSPPAAAWLRSYARLGCYLSLAVFMLLEYGWRRWHLRRLPQIGFCDFITRLTRVWPALLHDTARNAP